MSDISGEFARRLWSAAEPLTWTGARARFDLSTALSTEAAETSSRSTASDKRAQWMKPSAPWPAGLAFESAITHKFAGILNCTAECQSLLLWSGANVLKIRLQKIVQSYRSVRFLSRRKQWEVRLIIYRKGQRWAEPINRVRWRVSSKQDGVLMSWSKFLTRISFLFQKSRSFMAVL